ncbi:hypothetical protein [Salinimonas chungwhensis]|uniref:hypothetical protein n=1 Tax=Salinimonas chungwhensis TaxID=265425 RepID=UPI000371CC5E|nr:hypothetical protein [Salinimonas chungwhensis]
MSSSPEVTIVTLTKSDIRQAQIFSGISPKAMRRVFFAWIAFVVIISLLVIFAPDLSTSFTLITLATLGAFTLAMFAQSRISEGWPAILAVNEHLHVVRDPYKREFFCIRPAIVKDVVPTTIKPNKKAIELSLIADKLAKTDIEILNKAVWPRDYKLLALAHFISRDKACASLKNYIASAKAERHSAAS